MTHNKLFVEIYFIGFIYYTQKNNTQKAVNRLTA